MRPSFCVVEDKLALQANSTLGGMGMSYVALYRRWRPQSFDDIVGQPHVVRTLKNAIKTGRITHAYLFAGPRGTGKTSTARVLAKALNCEKGPTVEPCGACASCVAIRDGNSIDVVEIDAASNRGIEEIRELRERVMYAPTQGRYKVYIIDEAHMLTIPAFNALLKTLEEPPAHAVFVLATTQPESILPTIVSRCQRFDFNRLSVADLAAHVARVAETQRIDITPDAARLIARRAGGSARDALGLLEQAAAWGDEITTGTVIELLGLSPGETLIEFADAVARGDAGSVFRLIQEQVDAGADLRQFASDLVGHFRDLLVVKEAPNRPELLELREGAFAALSEQAARFSRQQLVEVLNVLSGLESQLRRASNPRVSVEIAAAGLCVSLGGAQSRAEAVEVEKAQTTQAEAVPVRAAAVQSAEASPAAPPRAQVARTRTRSRSGAGPKPAQPAQEAEAEGAEEARGPAQGRPVPSGAPAAEAGRFVGITEDQWERIRSKIRPTDVVLDAVLREVVSVRLTDQMCTVAFHPDWVVLARKASDPGKLATLARAVGDVVGRPVRCCVMLSSGETLAVGSEADSGPAKGLETAGGGVVSDSAPAAEGVSGAPPSPSREKQAASDGADLRSHPKLKAAVDLFDPKEIRTINS